MKTTNTGKGMNIFKVNSYEDIQKILIDKDKKIQDFVLQKIINYEHDLRVLVCGGEVLGCMKRIPQAGDFRANFSLGGSVEPFEITEEIKELAISAAKACELEVSGVDILVEKESGRLWLLEANRTPGLEGITQVIGNKVSDSVVSFMLENAR
jgi:RimK family alpha-L-glutamate ligase